MQNQRLSRDILQKCRHILLQEKQNLLNRVRAAAKDLSAADYSGDEIDQTVAQLQEHSALISQERARFQLMEIEMALARMEQGTYGICEETEELIEVQRLLAIPWTRLSIEGAEMREAVQKRFAK